MKEIITTGKTIDDARLKAAEEFNVSVDDITYEVLDVPKSGILGIGAKPARILAKYDDPNEAIAKNKKKEEAPKEKKPVKTLADFEPEKIKKHEPEKKNESEKKHISEITHEDIFKDDVDENFVPNENAEPFLENYLKNLFLNMGFSNVTFTINRQGKYLYIDLKGDDSGVLIGKRGDTLDAIQHIVQLALNMEIKGGEKVRIDTEGYREKRTKTLVSLAKSIANRVIKSRGKYELEPMKAYERKIIHAALQSYPMLTTYSVGVEPERRLIVAFKPKNKEE